MWSFGLIVASIFHPSHPAGLVSLGAALEMARSLAEEADPCLLPRTEKFLMDLPSDVRRLIGGSCLRIRAQDRLSSSQLLEQCLEESFFPDAFLDLLIPFLLIFSLKGCNAPLIRCLVLEAGTEHYLKQHGFVPDANMLTDSKHSNTYDSFMMWRHLLGRDLPYFDCLNPILSASELSATEAQKLPEIRSLRINIIASLGHPQTWDWNNGRRLSDSMLTLWKAALAQSDEYQESTVSQTHESPEGRQSEIEQDTALLRMADAVREEAWRTFFRIHPDEPQCEKHALPPAEVGDSGLQFLEVVAKMLQSAIFDSEGDGETVSRSVAALRRWLPLLERDYLVTEISVFFNAMLGLLAQGTSNVDAPREGLWTELLRAQLDVIEIIGNVKDGRSHRPCTTSWRSEILVSFASVPNTLRIQRSIRTELTRVCLSYPSLSLRRDSPDAGDSEMTGLQMGGRTADDRMTQETNEDLNSLTTVEQSQSDRAFNPQMKNRVQLKNLIDLLPRVCEIHADCALVEDNDALSDTICAITQSILRTDDLPLQLCLLSTVSACRDSPYSLQADANSKVYTSGDLQSGSAPATSPPCS